MDHAAPSEFPPSARLHCPHTPACPGCPLMTLDYAAQLAYKQRAVRAAFAAYPELAGVVPDATDPAERVRDYRARAKLVADGAALGLFARGTHRVVDIPHCRVLDPLLAAVFAALRRLLAATPGLLDGVDIARAGQALLVTLIAPQSSPEAALRELAAALQRELPAGSSVALAWRAPDAVQLLSAPAPPLFGAAELRVQAAPQAPYHYLAHGAFVQAHAQTSMAMRARIAARLAQEGGLCGLRVLELHAGSGALALQLAAHGAQVTAVESFAPACERLTRAAREQVLALRVLSGDAGAQTRALAAAGERFDVLLLNPPRRGLDPALRIQSALLRPKLIGYVSCRPSSLARDLAHFARLGYGCVSASPFDMMPQTEQVETLAWLTPAPAPLPELLYQDDLLLAASKPGLEAVSSPAAEASFLARLRRVPGCEHAVPLAALHSGSSGLLLLARAGHAREAAATAAAGAQWCWSVLVKGIARARGALPMRCGAARVRYERVAVLAGHSLLRVSLPACGPTRAERGGVDAQLLRAFARLGLPVLGDPRDRASAKHFALRHGLERPFLHAGELSFAGHTLRAALAPDLAGVLDSLGASALAQAV